MRPFEADRRVYLVLGAHLMNEDAADALLKDLEEPPPYAVIVLVADELGPLPPTIRSRCQLVPFRRLSQRAVKALSLLPRARAASSWTHSRGSRPAGSTAPTGSSTRTPGERRERPDRARALGLPGSRLRSGDAPRAWSRTWRRQRAEARAGRRREGAAAVDETAARARAAARSAPAGAPSARRSSTRSTSSPSWYRDLVVVAAGAEGAVAQLRPARRALRGRASRARARGRAGRRGGARGLALVRVPGPAGPRPRRRSSCGCAASWMHQLRRASCMDGGRCRVLARAGKVYSFDPGGLELAWNDEGRSARRRAVRSSGAS